MAKIRNKTVKRASRKIIETHFAKLSTNYEANKAVFKKGKIARIETKPLRNKVIGYTTRLMVRLQEGPVNGISLKLEEEEREKRDNYVPDKSAFDIEGCRGSAETYKMLEDIGFDFRVTSSSYPRRNATSSE